MKQQLTRMCLFAAAWLASAVVVHAGTVPQTALQAEPPVVRTAADCYGVGQRVASQNGGELLKASAETRGGQTVCRIIVRVPGKDGERPRRAEFVVPAG